MKYIYIILILIISISCGKREPIDNYKDSILYEKSNASGINWLTLKVNNEFIAIRVYDYDFNRYEVGDTIK